MKCKLLLFYLNSHIQVTKQRHNPQHKYTKYTIIYIYVVAYEVIWGPVYGNKKIP